MLLRELSPEVFDVDVLSEAAGEPVEMADIAKAARNEDGSLEKYVVSYGSPERTFYLSKNTHHEMAKVYRDMQAIYEQMPDGSVPRPVQFQESSGSVFYEEVKGKDVLSEIENTSEQERIQLFARIGERISDFHNMDTARFESGGKLAGSALECVMQTVNKDSFENIQIRNEDFCRRLRALYDKIVVGEKELVARKKLVVNHGDLHLANITRDQDGKIGLMDLTDVTVAPREKDIGGFLVQMRSMQRGGISTAEKMAEYKRAFLRGYGQAVDQNDIKFYQAWQLWRNAMYFAGKVDPDFARAEQDLAEATQLMEALEKK